MAAPGRIHGQQEEDEEATLLGSQESEAAKIRFPLRRKLLVGAALLGVVAAAAIAFRAHQGSTAGAMATVEDSISATSEKGKNHKHKLTRVPVETEFDTLGDVHVETETDTLGDRLKHLAQVAQEVSHELKREAANEREGEGLEFEIMEDEAEKLERDVEEGADLTKDAKIVDDLVGQLSSKLSPQAAARAGLELTVEDLDIIHDCKDKEGHLVHVEEANNRTFQGDMIPKDSEQLERFRRVAERRLGEGKSFATGNPWKDGIVKYCFAGDLPDAIKKVVNLAVGQYQKALPCLTWKNVGLKEDGEPWGKCQESPAIYIQSKAGGCSSYVGMIGSWESQKMQLAYPGCQSLGTVIHEFGHALGMSHEQARPDRDDNVQILWDNIRKGKEHNFEMRDTADDNRAYDLLSVMHYGATAFGDGKKTIQAKPAAYAKYTSDPDEYHKYKMGNRIGLTQSDVDQLADHYSSELSCTANKLVTSKECSDLPKNGEVWKDSHGQGCDVYVRMEKKGTITSCSKYSSGTYCCDCGGGLVIQSWTKSGSGTGGGGSGTGGGGSGTGGGGSGTGPLPPPTTPSPEPEPVPSPPPAPATCEDSETYKDPNWGDHCSAWKGYKCSGFKFTEELKKHCPVACRVCNPTAPKPTTTTTEPTTTTPKPTTTTPKPTPKAGKKKRKGKGKGKGKGNARRRRRRRRRRSPVKSEKVA